MTQRPGAPYRRRKRLFAFAAGVAVVLALQACLTEEGIKANPPTPAAALYTECTTHYNNSRFAEAVASCEASIEADSAYSQAYIGLAKATMGFHGVSSVEILGEFDQLLQDTSGRIAMLDHPDSVLTKRLQASARVLAVLDRLADRDSLTQWWYYLDDEVTAAEAADTAYQSRRDFMINYLVMGDLQTPGYRPAARFPLSDFAVRAQSFVVDRTIFGLVHSITRIYDFDNNGIIDFSTRDSMALKMGFGGTGGFDSLANLAEELENDSTLAQDLNQSLLNSIGHLGSLCQLLADCHDSTQAGNTPDSTNVDSVIASLGSSITFYMTGDKIDNDGDGCVDEEILDGKDNDLDGFVDEDSRTIPDTKSDGVDNDLDGRKDPLNPLSPSLFPPGNDSLGNEARVGAGVSATRPDVLGFVYRYLTAANELALPDAATTWVKIKKDAENMDVRIALQKDSLLLHRNPDGRLPDSLFAKLQAARADVGGCWRNLKAVSEP